MPRHELLARRARTAALLAIACIAIATLTLVLTGGINPVVIGTGAAALTLLTLTGVWIVTAVQARGPR